MDTWKLNFDGFVPAEVKLRETLLTLGNGFFATRGASEDSVADNSHYPGTYLAGGYNRLLSFVAGKEISNEDLVNWPNWLILAFRVDGDWLVPEKELLLEYNEELNIRSGVMKRTVRFKDREGRETRVESIRLVSMDDAHVAAQSWTITAINWSGRVTIKSAIDCNIINSGVDRYRALNGHHLIHLDHQWPEKGIFLVTHESSQSKLRVVQALRTIVFENGEVSKSTFLPLSEKQAIGLLISHDVRVNEPLRIEKVMCLYTSRDRSSFEPAYEALRSVKRLPGFDQLLNRHAKEWARLWNLCDIELPGRDRETRLLRLHIFHLLQTVSLKSLDLDVGVPARGLHGEAYRGHIFWDELFIIPFLNLRIPELSRALLMYRYRRLREARINASVSGFKGAMFPWQSGSNGEEENQKYHLNPASGNWLPDLTHLQRHINGAIIYNLWHYYQSTDDREFLSQYGMELALEICRFFSSAFVFSEEKGRYVLPGVIGPDEFHTHDPITGAPGVNNNSYTNFLASWCLRITVDLFLKLPEDRQAEILQMLELTRSDLNNWLELSKKIFLPMQGRIILPFEGAETLNRLNWTSYSLKYGNIQRLDRILEAEGDTVNRYFVMKQADVLMLFYLFSPTEFLQGLSWLGHSFSEVDIQKNIEHHLDYTTHGSSLSRIVHAWVLARYDSSRAWQLFDQSLETDVSDLQGGTTAEGIHLGAMAGTLDIIQRCFTGLEVGRDQLVISPNLPKELGSLKTMIHFRGHAIDLDINGEQLSIRVKHSHLPALRVEIYGRIYELKEGNELMIPLNYCPLQTE